MVVLTLMGLLVLTVLHALKAFPALQVLLAGMAIIRWKQPLPDGKAIINWKHAGSPAVEMATDSWREWPPSGGSGHHHAV